MGVHRESGAGDALSSYVVLESDEAGTTEHLGLVDDELFVAVHEPRARRSNDCLVVCPSILHGAVTSYRREVELCRELSRRGLSAVRLHYRGSGNSDGDPQDADLPSMLDDIARAGEVVGALGLVPSVFLGAKFGALIAAAAVRRAPGSALVLWEPAPTAKQFYREAFRSELVRDARDGQTERRDQAALLADLEERGVAEIVGQPLYRNLHATSRDLSLTDPPLPSGTSVLLVGVGRSSAHGALAAQLREAGMDLDERAVDSARSWWFHEDRVDDGLEELVAVTAGWVDALLAVDASAGAVR